MKTALTKRAIEAIALPAKGRTRVGDTRQPGLHIYITSTGKRSWYIYRKLDGRPIEFRLGDYPAISPETARTLAAAAVAKLAAGVDVQEERVQARNQPKLSAVWEHFLAHHAEPRLRPLSVRTYRCLWRVHLEPWGNRRLSAIDLEDVREWHQQTGAAHGRYVANASMKLLRSLYNHAHSEMGYRGENPTTGVKRYAEPSRDRFLSGDEIRRLYLALETETEETRDYVKLSLLTGGRRANVLAMRWDALDLQSCVWVIPATEAKAHKPIHVPLCDPALSILARRKESTAGSPWVFPSADDPQRHVSYNLPRIIEGWERARAAAGIPDVRLHDLRRSLATLAVASGASLPAVGKLLGHSGLSATQVYARADLAAIRQAVSGAVGLIEHATTKMEGKGNG